ncbi:hypothetical protein P171DRAFT_522314 [Karstenula rhodostoma CBS 690.94]|uniref:Heterokaryon incompatibility domain-containing protein n=1 Tax=Karstenula rhodostoma CBS 690.94 TaxID=1392251 RepID=A0A9P4PJ67_9PLEO|nr:hypothetical protein P171DRAFT_522314 [Karstenula rhodostoma CBS 690.94]
MSALRGRLPLSRNDEHSALITAIIEYDAAQKDSYIYGPLTETDSIRLLRIQPVEDIDADLHLSLAHTTLSAITASNEDPLAFIALSYCWGPQVFRKAVYIEVSDEAMRIAKETSDTVIEECAMQRREDLKKQLSEMPLSTLLAWGEEAEQLAEDNSRKAAHRSYTSFGDVKSTPKLHIGRNIRERNHQVLHMREIYQKASKTIVYLGDEMGNTTLSAWNFLERAAVEGGEKGKHNTQYFKGDLGDVEIDVLTRPWFRRVWVVQEIAVSTNITMQSGQHSISWDDFCKIVLLEPRVNDRYGFSLRNKQLFENELRGNYVLDMVARSRRLEATDPRDKFFALLGISSGVDPEDPRIAVDYSKTFRQVYEDFAHYLIDAGRNFDVLSYTDRGTSWGAWPSWVPDWRQPMPTSRSTLGCIASNAGEGQDRQHETRGMNHPGQRTERIFMLEGNDELAFEQIRQECGANPEKMETRILERWKTYPWGIEQRWKVYPWVRGRTAREEASSSKIRSPFWSYDRPLDPDTRPWYHHKLFTPSLGKKLSLDPNETEQVVLDHLIQRSRQTLVWTDDSSMAVETVLDTSSIIDNRWLGLMVEQNTFEPNQAIPKSTTLDSSTKEGKARTPSSGVHHALVLVPRGAGVNDYVVSLIGARVPLVIRASPASLKDRPIRSHLVGECLVEDADVVGSEPRQDTLGSFQSRPLQHFSLR